MRHLFYALLRLPISVRWLIWILFVAAWTTALLVPDPGKWVVYLLASIKALLFPDAGELNHDGITGWPKFLIAKTVHISAYAVLAVLTGWLCTRGRLRLAMLAFLLLHAAGTEYLQYVMDVGREGSPRDVALNLVGISIGMAASWPWWRQEPLTLVR